MKRFFLALILITACAFAQAVVCFSEETTPTSYEMEIVLFESEQAANISLRVTYCNTTGEPLNHLMFSLYANCFRRESTLPYDNDTLIKAFPYGYAPGGMDIKSIRVDGEEAMWAVSGENEAYLRVPVALESGDTCVIDFEYTLLLTKNHAFLGMSDTDIRFTGFYPSLCVYEDGDFALNALTRAGRSLYSGLCNFDIRLILPSDYDIACAGEIASLDAEDRKIISFRIENARQAAFAVSRKFHKKTDTSASGVLVSAYGQARSDLKEAAGYAASAIDFFEKTIAPFPYSSFTLCFSSLAGQNLSASGIALLARDGFDKTEICKQVALQYFYDRVHPNPAMEAWLSDGLAEYLAMICIRETEGDSAFARLLNSRVLPSLQITIPGGLTPASESTRFQTISEYETVISLRGAAALHEVETAMGEEAFLSGIKEYCKENAFKTPVSDDFVRAFERATGRNWANAIYHWLYTIDEYAGENLYEYN